jgi:hypothetical protein
MGCAYTVDSWHGGMNPKPDSDPKGMGRYQLHRKVALSQPDGGCASQGADYEPCDRVEW